MNKEFKEAFSNIGFTAAVLTVYMLLLYGGHRVVHPDLTPRVPLINNFIYFQRLDAYKDCVDNYFRKVFERIEAKKNGIEVPPIKKCSTGVDSLKYNH